MTFSSTCENGRKHVLICKKKCFHIMFNYQHVLMIIVFNFLSRFLFAAIGALVTMRWIIVFLVSLHGSTFTQYSPSVPQNEQETSQETSEPITDCYKTNALEELSDRLHLLEIAFKEQVFARETIVREINDQSDIYGSLDRKLALFLEKLDNVTQEYVNLESKYKELSTRVNSDGMCFEL